jgi:hypothetical protein
MIVKQQKKTLFFFPEKLMIQETNGAIYLGICFSLFLTKCFLRTSAKYSVGD